MHILLLANHFNTGGITAYILNLCRALNAKDGIKFTVASRGGDQEGCLKQMGIEHIRLPLTTKNEASPKVLLSFLKLRPLVEQNAIDLIHANTRVTQVIGCWLSCVTARPYLSTCHGYFKNRFHRCLFPCWGKAVIAISEQVKEHLEQDFQVEQKRIDLIVHGIELGKFIPHSSKDILDQKKALGLDPDKKVIGQIARLSSVKGQRFLIQAAQQILDQRQDVQFLLVGEGPEQRALETLIAEKQLKESVLIRPSVSDISLTLALMDVFVMPSLQEGLGLSVLEAQAQGIPVVATRVGGILSIIEDRKTGLLCPEQNSQALASAVLRMLEDQALRQSVIQAARVQLQDKFSLSAMAQKTKALYQRLLC